MGGFKFWITLQVIFCKKIENVETKYYLPIYFDSETETVIKDLHINKILVNYGLVKVLVG